MKYDEKKLYNDIEDVFKNEDFIDILDYIVEEKHTSIELYYIGWCGEKAFYNKIDKYGNRLKELGYNIEIIKGIYDENDGIYAQIYFMFN